MPFYVTGKKPTELGTQSPFCSSEYVSVSSTKAFSRCDIFASFVGS